MSVPDPDWEEELYCYCPVAGCTWEDHGYDKDGMRTAYEEHYTEAHESALSEGGSS